jgi:phospholipase/carboxylesterase
VPGIREKVKQFSVSELTRQFNDRSLTKFSVCLLRPMPKIIADIPASLSSVLHEEIVRTKTDASFIVTAALTQYLQTPIHTLFQVSTSGALMAGAYSDRKSAAEDNRSGKGGRMNQAENLGFVHTFVPGRSGRTLLLLHGPGGNENDLIPLGRELDSDANLLSPRGKVLENGMPRFFRRLAEGIFDEEDLIRRTHELADFIERAATKYNLNRQNLFAVGYSNGANIAASLLLLRPKTLSGAALLRGMVPLVPETLPDLEGIPVLLASSRHDPIIPADEALELATMLGKAGADVSVSWDDGGHRLTWETIQGARRWLGTVGSSEAAIFDAKS